MLVLMGPPGAGKTTWIEQNRPPGSILCSTERIRQDPHLRSGAPAAAYLARMRARAAEALSEGRSVVVDGCNTRPQDRSTWLAMARTYGARAHLVVIHAGLPTLLAAQRTRAHPVAEDKVKGYYQQYRRALPVLHAERWDRIMHVHRSNGTSTSRPRRVSNW
jgi:predicted kinase